MDKFEQVIVIGYGVITRDVLATVWKYGISYGYKITYIEHEVYPFNIAMKFAKANDINTEVIEDKAELTTYFRKITRGARTLIISASNNYIFPSELVTQDNITIINFHNALLPDLPGRNAPSWAIYEGRDKTGITWHYVTAGVDEGDIIIQKECVITSDMRAYELVATQMQLAAEAFEEIYEAILKDDVQVTRQCFPKGRKLYKSKEIPGGGTFDLEDDPKDIYKLLRAIDYGKSDVFPMATTQYHGERVRVRRYKKVDRADVRPEEYKIYLPLEDNMFLMLRIDKLCKAF